ncbi:MAG TPA: protein kinase [Kofleriaceae bacterium]|nr:protein kinase [Kofleriaceae bacterium]
MALASRPAIARYHLLGKLGSGGMGDVWLARAAGPAGFEKLVALKTIKSGDGANDPLTKMFVQEARVAALLSHPNCVQVFELGEDAGTYFIAMEYIEGFSFSRVLRRAAERGIRLPIPVVARILVDAAAGLEYAHALKDSSGEPLGLVHRDVSLENLLVTFTGQTKVVDFGIAKLNALAGERTETGMVKGKYAYMAPEYVRGEAIDGRADVFALGVVGYRALAREKPFGGETDAQLIAQLLSPVEAPRVAAARPEVPAALDEAIAKALAKDPAQRFDGARAMRTAIAAAVPDLADADEVAAVMGELWSERDPEREATRQLAAVEPGAQTTPLSARLPRPSTSAETTPAAHVTTVDGPPPAPARANRRRFVPAAAIALAGAGVAVFVFARGGGAKSDEPAPALKPPPIAAAPPADAGAAAPASASTDSRQRVAVLPFASSTASPAPDFVPAGLRDSLSGKLGKLDRVTVAATKATDAVAKQPPAKIGHELGVATIVTGTVGMDHDRLEVDLAVVDAATGHETFTHHYSGSLGDLLTVDDAIARDVIAAIGVTPSGDERAQVTAHPTDKADAYALYLQAKREASEITDPNAQEAAIALYERAIALDGRFALAYAGLAISQIRVFTVTKAPIWTTRALSAAQQAARIDDKLAEVHDALGVVYKLTGHTKEAIAEYGIAVKLAPSSDEGFRHLSSLYLGSGRLPEASAAIEHAIELNPYYWANYLGCVYVYDASGNFDRAEACGKKAIELAPDKPTPYMALGLAYGNEGDHERAIAVLQKGIAIEPTGLSYGNLGNSYANLGRFADAKVAYEHALALAPTDPQSVGGVADAHLWAGDPDYKALYAKAIAMANDGLAVNPRDANLVASVALWLAKVGNPAKARKMIARAREIDPGDIGIRYLEVLTSTWNHQLDDAFRQLDALLAAGWRVAAIVTDPDLAPLRSDPRFAALVKKYTKPAPAKR